MDFSQYGLGWSEPDPSQRGHELLYRASDVFGSSPIKVNYVSDPRLEVATLEDYNQGREGACVGFGWTRERTIANGKKYAARWFYKKAQTFDPWPGDQYSGTTVHAGAEVALNLGHVVSDDAHSVNGVPSLEEGIERVVWARTVDEMRAAFYAAQEKSEQFGIVVGCNWYQGFFTPELHDGAYWVGRDQRRWGRVAGGHCICLNGAMDDYDAFIGIQSWGKGHPYPFRMTYDAWDRLRREGAEIAIVTDRVAPAPPPPTPANGEENTERLRLVDACLSASKKMNEALVDLRESLGGVVETATPYPFRDASGMFHEASGPYRSHSPSSLSSPAEEGF